MIYSLVVRPEVDTDLIAAEAWYENKEAGLGREFLFDVREAMLKLRRNPQIHQVRLRRKQVRWAYPKRFPYRIVFRVEHEAVVIYAVSHAARHDRHWKQRF